MNTPSIQSRNTLEALRRLEKVVLNTLDFRQVIQKICDSVLNELYFFDLSYRIVLLALTDDKNDSLQIVAFSRTPEAQRATQTTKISFLDINIPLSDPANLAVKVNQQQNLQISNSWDQIFSPALTQEIANSAQKAADVQASTIVPIVAKGKSLGVMIFGIAKPTEMVSSQEQELMQGFTDIVAIAVENAKLYSSLDQASKQLENANTQLKKLDQLKDEFVSAAAHALRSPMTAIKGYLSMVIEGDAGQIPTKAKEFLSGAYNGNDRLIRLVNHMLDISRIESGRLIFNIADVKLDELIQSEVDQLKILAQEKQLSLVYQKPQTSLPIISVDPDRMREVINNLIGNAIKFTQKGSITIKHEIKGNNLLTHVTDTGQGIAPEDLQNLFQKFTQARMTSGRASGSGLGLYVSKIIAQEFKGDITATSQVGKGSTFTISLPIKTR